MTACTVSMARLDQLTNHFMAELYDWCRFEPKSLDEFLIEYQDEMDDYSRQLGFLILNLYPKYGGENDPE